MIKFENVYERDMDLFLMKKISTDRDFVINFFLRQGQLAAKGYDKTDFTVEKVSHSVRAADGESDIEAVLFVEGKKVALLIEDKIDAPPMPEQAKRYSLRGQKAIERGEFEEFYVFIIAPENYLKSNAEAKKYDHCISYEEIQMSLEDVFEKALIKHALSEANNVRLPRDARVTAFWDMLYDFLDEKYPGIFQVHGHRGLERSGQAGQWITMTCAKPYSIQIKSDRGYVDLEIGGHAEHFLWFSKNNSALIDQKRLYIRTAGKSLAIRMYTNQIDFTQPFETQIPSLTVAFDAAKELQDLIPKLKIQ